MKSIGTFTKTVRVTKTLTGTVTEKTSFCASLVENENEQDKLFSRFPEDVANV